MICRRRANMTAKIMAMGYAACSISYRSTEDIYAFHRTYRQVCSIQTFYFRSNRAIGRPNVSDARIFRLRTIQNTQKNFLSAVACYNKGTFGRRCSGRAARSTKEQEGLSFIDDKKDKNSYGMQGIIADILVVARCFACGYICRRYV